MGIMEKDISEEAAREIDGEVRNILDDAYAGAKRIPRKHRDKLDSVANELLEKETLDTRAFKNLVEGKSDNK